VAASCAQVRALRDTATARAAATCPLLLDSVPQGRGGDKGARGAGAAGSDRARRSKRSGGIAPSVLCLLWGGDARKPSRGCEVLLSSVQKKSALQADSRGSALTLSPAQYLSISVCAGTSWRL